MPSAGGCLARVRLWLPGGWEGPPAPLPPASLIPWADGSGCAPGRALMVAVDKEGTTQEEARKRRCPEK